MFLIYNCFWQNDTLFYVFQKSILNKRFFLLGKYAFGQSHSLFINLNIKKEPNFKGYKNKIQFAPKFMKKKETRLREERIF